MSSNKQKLRWDPKTVEIRTKSVEKNLEPLIKQITTIVEFATRPPRRGYSKKVHELVKEQGAATHRLVEEGQRIADDYPDMKEYVLDACDEVTMAGDKMEKGSQEFAYDPCNEQKRATMVRAARALLAAVTRLLCVADMADVENLLQHIHKVEGHVKNIYTVDQFKPFFEMFDGYGKDLHQLLKGAAYRQSDLKNQTFKDDIAAARSSLQRHSRILYTASKAHLDHPDSSSALENRDFALNQIDDALSLMSKAFQGYGEGKHSGEGKGELFQLFEDLLERVDRPSEHFRHTSAQKEIRSLVEEIAEQSMQLGETLEESKEVRAIIHSECRNMNTTMEALLLKAVNGSSKDIELAKGNLKRRCVQLLKYLRNCLANSIADVFLHVEDPLISLMEAAQLGAAEETKKRSEEFLRHNAKMLNVSKASCIMSGSPDKMKLVRLCAAKVSQLGEQVCHAAITTSQHAHSAFAKENMHLIRDMWVCSQYTFTHFHYKNNLIESG